jgi:predicted AAA+ superfamily ATPase
MSIISRMIQRRLTEPIRQHLQLFPALVLLGPRQVGKTTLASRIADDTESVYLDLENPHELAKLEDARGFLAAQRGKLVFLDEVQRMPGLFQVLRGLIDEGIRENRTVGQFMMLGSASIELLRQSSETLAGRIAYMELSPFDVLEMGADQAQLFWIRGGFPRSFLADDETQSVMWRENFIRTYLERDIPQMFPESLVRMKWISNPKSTNALVVLKVFRP